MQFNSINDLISQHSHTQPHAPAIHYQDKNNHWQHISWVEYATQIKHVASALHAQTNAEERFGILLNNCLEWDILEKAGFQARLIVAGIDPYAPPSYQQYILQDAKISILAVRNIETLKRLTLETLPHLRLIIILEGTIPSDFTPIKVVQYSELTTFDMSETLPVIRSDHDAVIVYTSGTSGHPKGIAYTHSQYLHICFHCVTSSKSNTASRFVCWLPLANLLQRIINLSATYIGASLYILADPKQLMKEIGYINPTFLIGVPRFYEKVVAGTQTKIASLPAPLRALSNYAIRLGTKRVYFMEKQISPPLWYTILYAILDRLVLKKIRTGLLGTNIQFLLSGSAPIDLKVIHFFYAIGVPLYEGYGQSENIAVIALNTHENFRFGSVGKPYASNEVIIGANDEIWVRGPGVFKTYLDGNTENKFTADGLLATGDKGHIDKDGYLYLSGRIDDMIKISTGRKITPVKIEQQLAASCPAFDQIIVIGQGRKHVIALVSLQPEIKDFAQSEWMKAISQVNEKLADYEKIYGVLLIPPLTIESELLTPNFKIKRKKIEERYTAAIETLYQRIEHMPLQIMIMKADPIP